MYTHSEQEALTKLFAPDTPAFTISRTAMKILAQERFVALRAAMPSRELYWVTLEEDLCDLLDTSSLH